MSRHQSQKAINMNFLHGFGALSRRQFRDLYSSPVLLLITLSQPVIWLVLYGQSIPIAQLPGIASNYFSFLSVGMLSFVVMFAAIFSGMSIVFDRQLGFLKKVLVTSMARGSIIMSYVVSNVIKSLVQVAILLGVAAVLGMNLSHITFTGLGGAFAAEALLAIGLSTFFTMVAIISENSQTQLAIMNFISLPLLFVSNGLFPTSSMPMWLQYVAKVNPLSYANDAARQLLLGSTGMTSLYLDFAFLIGFAGLFSIMGIILSWRYLNR